eukprot:scaffold18244_cov70-Cyclotella_meneghiniana.AAC.5
MDKSIFIACRQGFPVHPVAIDETRDVEQSGRSFRKELVEAARFLDTMIQSMKNEKTYSDSEAFDICYFSPQKSYNSLSESTLPLIAETKIDDERCNTRTLEGFSVNKNPGSANNPGPASLKIWKLCVSSRLRCICLKTCRDMSPRQDICLHDIS